MSTPSSRVGLLASLAIIFAVALALRYPIADVPLERDEGEYAYIAQRWLQGEVPYRDSFDQKPPGAFVAFLVMIACGAVTPAGLHWGTQVYTLGTLALVYLLGRKLFSPAAGLAAGLFCAVMLADAAVFGNSSNTEVFLVLPVAGAVLALVYAVERDRLGWALAAGLLGGVAILFKQVAALPVAFLVLWALARGQRRLLLAGSVAVAAAVPALLVAGLFAAFGAGREFYDCVLGYNLKYASKIPLSSYPGAFWPPFRSLLLSFWPVYALAGLTLIHGARHRGTTPGRPVLLLAGWLTAAFLGTATGGRFFPHYFLPTILPTALLAGAALAGLTAGFRSPALRTVVPVLVALGVIGYAVLLKPWYYLTLGGEAKCTPLYGGYNVFGEAPEIARFLAEQSSPDDTVFILGSEPQVYYYAGRRCASRYIFVYPLMDPGDHDATRRRQLDALEELSRTEPDWILTVFVPSSLGELPPRAPPDLLDGVRQRLDASYRVAAVLPFRDGGHAPLLTGEDAVRLFRQRPTWYDRWRDPAHRSCSVVVWRKVR